MSVRMPLLYIIDCSTNTQKDDAEEEHAVLAALESSILSEEGSLSMVSRSTQSSFYEMVGWRNSCLKIEVELIYRTPLVITIRVHGW